MPIKPKALRSGDTIGLVTLGSPLDRSVIDERVGTLQDMGFKVVMGKTVYLETGFLAGTDEERAADLMSMFRNPAVKMILPVRGGVGVAGILPYLDYKVIGKNPKIITGYSDITILLNVLYELVDLITFHSLLLIDFKPETPDYSFNQFFFGGVGGFAYPYNRKSAGHAIGRKRRRQRNRAYRGREYNFFCGNARDPLRDRYPGQNPAAGRDPRGDQYGVPVSEPSEAGRQVQGLRRHRTGGMHQLRASLWGGLRGADQYLLRTDGQTAYHRSRFGPRPL